MLDHFWLVVTYLLVLGCIGYIFAQSRLKARARRKDEAIPNAPIEPAETAMSKGENGEQSARPEVAELSASLPIFDTPDVIAVPITNSELHYFKPFGPQDTIFDAWSKLQTFRSIEPITIRLSSNDHCTPIVVSKFSPDGIVHSTGAMLYQDLEDGIRDTGDPTFWRALRALSSFGIPSAAPESTYYFYTGPLRLQLKGVEILGLRFTINVTFEPNLGLISGHFSHVKEYFHCEVSSHKLSNRSPNDRILVGFPWTLSSISLRSMDTRLDHEVSAIIISAIVEKYAKYVRQSPLKTPTQDDHTRMLTLISDGIVAISVCEGTFHTKVSQGTYLQVTYSPLPNGALDAISAGDVEFRNFAGSLAGNHHQSEKDKAEMVLATPF